MDHLQKKSHEFRTRNTYLNLFLALSSTSGFFLEMSEPTGNVLYGTKIPSMQKLAGAFEHASDMIREREMKLFRKRTILGLFSRGMLDHVPVNDVASMINSLNEWIENDDLMLARARQD